MADLDGPTGFLGQPQQRVYKTYLRAFISLGSDAIFGEFLVAVLYCTVDEQAAGRDATSLYRSWERNNSELLSSFSRHGLALTRQCRPSTALETTPGWEYLQSDKTADDGGRWGRE